MESEHNLYVGCFYDANALSTDGFDTLIAHNKETLKLTTTIINLIETRFTAESNWAKNLQKSLKPFMENDDGPNTLIPIVSKIFSYENTFRGKMCTDIIKLFLQPFQKDTLAQINAFNKTKSDCLRALKTRKDNYNLATKACKMYTLKYQSYNQLFKKFPNQQDLDYKETNEILKSQQSLISAEKDARTAVEMLQKSLFKYDESLESLCEKVEIFDRVLIDGCAQLLTKIHGTYLLFLKDRKFVYFIDLLSYLRSLKAFLLILLPNLTTVENDSKEFKLNLSAEPIENEYTLRRASTIDSHASKSNNSTKLNTILDGIELKLPSSQIFRGNSQTLSVRLLSNREKKVVALYDYEAENADEINFKVGDTIEIIEQVEENWYLGRLATGSTGLFPINYVGPI
ncbi:hypothetical protein HZS_7117, partial [Henneguya salminicola]